MNILKTKKAVLAQYEAPGGTICFHLIVGTKSVQRGEREAKKALKDKGAFFMKLQALSGDITIDEQKGEVYYTNKPTEIKKFNTITIL